MRCAERTVLSGVGTDGSDTPEINPPVSEAHLSEIGDLLREARGKKSITIDEAADVLRIKASFLEALEHGDYSALPGPAYITGFLRNYAAYLGLHPDDVIQDYYSTRPMAQPSVKAATRVLASGQDRRSRSRLFWTLGVVALFLAGGFAIKMYNDTYDHAYSAPLNVTPANLGATSYVNTTAPANPKAAAAIRPVHLRLQAVAPVWVRVTADNKQVYQGILRGSSVRWSGRHAIYVATYDGSHLRVIYDGRHLGPMARNPGLVFYAATPTGWHHVA